ncbi:hypothetical protein ACVWZL_005989 [Bradyrhizobium sp. GM2.4]
MKFIQSGGGGFFTGRSGCRLPFASAFLQRSAYSASAASSRARQNALASAAAFFAVAIAAAFAPSAAL